MKSLGFCVHSDAERALEGVWSSRELEHAIRRGYTVITVCSFYLPKPKDLSLANLQIKEIWHWPEMSNDLFKGQINALYARKFEASGWSDDLDSEAAKDREIAHLQATYGISVDKAKVMDNPARRVSSKLALNAG